MSEIEKMQRYIERTKTGAGIKNPYAMCTNEMDAVYQAMKTDPFSTIILLFEYGRDKGYRAAKAEGRARA